MSDEKQSPGRVTSDAKPIRHQVAGIWCVTIPADEYDRLTAGRGSADAQPDSRLDVLGAAERICRERAEEYAIMGEHKRESACEQCADEIVTFASTFRMPRRERASAEDAEDAAAIAAGKVDTEPTVPLAEVERAARNARTADREYCETYGHDPRRGDWKCKRCGAEDDCRKAGPTPCHAVTPDIIWRAAGYDVPEGGPVFDAPPADTPSSSAEPPRLTCMEARIMAVDLDGCTVRFYLDGASEGHMREWARLLGQLTHITATAAPFTRPAPEKP